MNVLLTCAGRRNYLIKFFQDAVKDRGYVFATDSSADAPSLQEADAGFVVPMVTHVGYFNILFELCQQQQVRLLVPLNDLELPLLARQRDRFSKIGTVVAISSPTVVDLCFDKWESYQFLKRNGIATPKTYLSLAEARQALNKGELTFPLVVKPRWGSASIGIAYPEDDEELELTYQFVKKLLAKSFLAEASASDPNQSILIQAQLSGREYGLDVINDLGSKPVTTLVKQKLAMRAGETERAITVKDPALERLGAIIGQKLGHVGNLDCDVMVGGDTFFVLEMNPRFGGGYPFSHMAGANLPAVLVAWAQKEIPDTSWLEVEPNVMASKCDRLVLKRNASTQWLAELSHEPYQIRSGETNPIGNVHKTDHP